MANLSTITKDKLQTRRRPVFAHLRGTMQWLRLYRSSEADSKPRLPVKRPKQAS